MIATKARADVSVHPDQAAITATSSLAAVKALIQVGFGCITFIRGILSDDNFDDQTLNGSRNEGMLSTSSSGTPGSQVSSGSTKVKMVKRKFSTEADTLLDYLEIGIFDALEKQYLKSFIFAIYLDEKDPKNLVESYTFNFSYHNVEGTDEAVPVMSIESSMSKLGLMDGADPVGKASTNGQVPTLGDVKKSARSLVKRLIGICQSMEPLPDRRFATFKIYYHENTPSEYEPPHFVAGDAEKDRFFFATHNVNEVPERCSVGGIKTGKHSVDIQIASICSILPSPDDNLAPFHGHAHNRNTPRPDYNTMDAKRKADARAQVADAERRQVVWDADPPEEDAEGDVDPEFESEVGEAPVGVRKDGEIVPIPVVAKEKGKGKEREKEQEKVVRHGGGRHRVPGLNDPEALQNSELEGATQIIETQATVIIPSGAVVSTQDHQRAIETQMDIDRGIDTLELRQMLNDEQDVTMEDSQMPGGSPSTLTQANKDRSRTPRPIKAAAQEEPTEKEEVEQLPSTPIPAAIDPVIVNAKRVECDCGVEGADHDTFVCQGDCGRRLHAWCMGFHTAKEAGYSPYSQCLGCELRSMVWFDLLEEKEKHKLSQNLAELALYRRTLKKVYAEGLPGNPHALQRLVGCTRQDAMHNLNRMEAEEFIQTRTTQTDELGFLTSETITKTTKASKKKPNKKNGVKPQPVLITTRAALKALERYFDPRGDLEKELVDSYRSKCEARKKKGKGKGKKAPAGNILVPSSSVNIPSQQEERIPIVEPISRNGAPSRSLPPQDMETQTQQETQMLLDTRFEFSSVAPPSPPTTRQAPKRKSSARITNNQAKKLKISLANFGVDLETFD